MIGSRGKRDNEDQAEMKGNVSVKQPLCTGQHLPITLLSPHDVFIL